MEDRSGSYYGEGVDMHESADGDWCQWSDVESVLLRAAAHVASLGIATDEGLDFRPAMVGNNPADAAALSDAHAILYDACRPGPDQLVAAALEAIKAIDAVLMFDGQAIGHADRMHTLRGAATMLRVRTNFDHS
jgi:hypothetical protein